MLWCMLALLLVKATTQPIDLQSTPPAPTQQHAAPPPQPTAASMAPDAGEAEPALSSPASLPIDVMKSAERGELHEVVEWLDEGGSVDAMCSVPAGGGDAQRPPNSGHTFFCLSVYPSIPRQTDRQTAFFCLSV